MEINFSISPYPALLENMVAKVYETQSPDAEVGSITIPEKDNTSTPTVGAGHQVINNLSFTGRDNIPHIVRLFTASGTKLFQYDVQPTTSVVTIFTPIYFVIGDSGTYTPPAGSATLSNPGFSGLSVDDITIFMRGLGPLIPTLEYTISGSTVSLVDLVFNEAEQWYIQRKPQTVTTPVNDSVVGKIVGSFVDISANKDYEATDLRKLIRLSGTGDYTFPVGANIPIGYSHKFNQFGNLTAKPKVKFLNGNLLYAGTPLAEIEMPFGSTATFTWDGTSWNLTDNGIKTTTTPQILYAGSYYIGDILGGDRTYTITHGQSISGSYRVFGTWLGLANNINDNNICWNVYNLQPNSFVLNTQEIFTGIQDLTFDYILVKL